MLAFPPVLPDNPALVYPHGPGPLGPGRQQRLFGEPRLMGRQHQGAGGSRHSGRDLREHRGRPSPPLPGPQPPILAPDHARILRAMREEQAARAETPADEVEERDLAVYDQITEEVA